MVTAVGVSTLRFLLLKQNIYHYVVIYYLKVYSAFSFRYYHEDLLLESLR